MFKTEGSLRVRRINGRNGEFAVGTLSTSIGKFVVKDPELDQYDAGEYEGDFGITEVAPRSYFTDGRLVVEMRAFLAFMVINTKDEDVVDEPPVEMDPIEEPPQASVAKAEVTSIEAKAKAKSESSETTTKPHKPDSEPVGGQTQSDDESLFGATIYPDVEALADVIRLDPTIDRQRFRHQTSRLKELGYRFNFTEQQWEYRKAA
ncbi:MAG: DUF3275 family protein [Gammaproteobacteria bacterium]|nr:DUF3275 family protein [Gammaproteobacteria bacterium]MCP5135420.1 DUF3275 family protein [Gammaproteobacteria bacterium]